MADKDILIAKAIDGAMAYSLIGFLIALDNGDTATIEHVDATIVEVRTIDGLTASDNNTICAAYACTAIVP